MSEACMIRTWLLTFDIESDLVWAGLSFDVFGTTRVESGMNSPHFLKDQRSVGNNDASVQILVQDILLWKRES